jgi:hypothetical protein
VVIHQLLATGLDLGEWEGVKGAYIYMSVVFPFALVIMFIVFYTKKEAKEQGEEDVVYLEMVLIAGNMRG